ncbi:MAG: hypothetical protein U5L04_01945 [Trueperaceae bacterium]|nr:hypothetical protein [Trueperaceae bacterium]
MKTCLLPITLVMVALGAAQSPTEEVVPLVWSHVVASEALDTATDIALDAAGNVVVVGVTRGDVAGVHRGGDDMVVVKLTAAGEEVWRRQFGGRGDDEATAVAVDAAGDIWVVGATRDEATEARTRNLPERDLTLHRLAADGTLLWQRRYTDDGDERVVDLSFGDGALYMVGTQTHGDVARGLVMAVDAVEGDTEGEMLWQQLVGEVGSETYAVAVLGGEVVVGGSSPRSITLPQPNDGRVERDVTDVLRLTFAPDGTQRTTQIATLPVTPMPSYLPFRVVDIVLSDERLYALAGRSAGNDFGSGGYYLHLFDLGEENFGTGLSATESGRLPNDRLWTVFVSAGQEELAVAENGRVYAGGPFVTSYLAGEDDTPFIDLRPLGWHASALVYDDGVYDDGALYAAGFNQFGETSGVTPGDSSDMVVFKLAVGR